MIFVYNLCPASRKCQYLTSGFERCDGAQVRLLPIIFLVHRFNRSEKVSLLNQKEKKSSEMKNSRFSSF